MGEEEAGETFLKSVQCPRTNCIFTHNKSMLTHTNLFDAIVFHGPEDIPFLPPDRLMNQFYILFALE